MKKRDLFKIEQATNILEHQEMRLRELAAPDVVRDPRNAGWAWLYLLAVSTKERPPDEHLELWRERWESTQRQLLFDASVNFALGLHVEDGLDKVFCRETKVPHPTGQWEAEENSDDDQ